MRRVCGAGDAESEGEGRLLDGLLATHHASRTVHQANASRLVARRFPAARGGWPAPCLGPSVSPIPEVSMKAQDIMSRNPSTVTPSTRVRQAAKLMKDEDVGIVPVVEEGGGRRLVGLLTDRDIAIRLVAEGRDP